ncbi:MAG TPA: hypothetical protein VM054_05955 [bacterium]|nr:hypothetical protein [bacterium]
MKISADGDFTGVFHNNLTRLVKRATGVVAEIRDLKLFYPIREKRKHKVYCSFRVVCRNFFGSREERDKWFKKSHQLIKEILHFAIPVENVALKTPVKSSIGQTIKQEPAFTGKWKLTYLSRKKLTFLLRVYERISCRIDNSHDYSLFNDEFKQKQLSYIDFIVEYKSFRFWWWLLQRNKWFRVIRWIFLGLLSSSLFALLASIIC